MDWKIYYADGSTYSDDDGSPETAPPDGIEVIVQTDPRVGRSIIDGKDWYVFDGCKWVGMDDDGMKAWFRQQGLVKQGLTLSRPRYDEILHAALTDPDFPKKSARYPDEPTVR
jgi:hypothetical protein